MDLQGGGRGDQHHPNVGWGIAVEVLSTFFDMHLALEYPRHFRLYLPVCFPVSGSSCYPAITCLLKYDKSSLFSGFFFIGSWTIPPPTPTLHGYITPDTYPKDMYTPWTCIPPVTYPWTSIPPGLIRLTQTSNIYV